MSIYTWWPIAVLLSSHGGHGSLGGLFAGGGPLLFFLGMFLYLQLWWPIIDLVHTMVAIACMPIDLVAIICKLSLAAWLLW